MVLDITRATVVLPVPGAPVKTKCPNSGHSDPSCQRVMLHCLKMLKKIIKVTSVLKQNRHIDSRSWLLLGHSEGIAHLLQFQPRRNRIETKPTPRWPRCFTFSMRYNFSSGAKGSCRASNSTEIVRIVLVPSPSQLPPGRYRQAPRTSHCLKPFF